MFISVQFLTKIASVVMFIFGTVALSSQIFISLGDVVLIIARLMSSTLVYRAILSFELHGLQEVTSQSLEETAASTRDGYGILCGKDST
jgi:hypothetical protein